MSTTIDTAGEEWRRICEARSYIRKGITTAAAVDELMREISKLRGAEAAAELREEMRRQWRTRPEWLGAGQ